MPPQEVMADFLRRIKYYEMAYEPVEKDECQGAQIIKIINQGEEIRLNYISGWITSRLVFFLMNLHIGRRRIWLCRHGESEYNRLGKIGGDSNLSDRGKKFSHLLKDFILQRMETIKAQEELEQQKLDYAGAGGQDQPRSRSGSMSSEGSVRFNEENMNDERETVIWTSTLQRSKQTGMPLSKHFPLVQWKCLDEIDAGICDGMTYEEIEEKFPDEFEARSANKFLYRYPQGESYFDIINRLEPCLVELERAAQDIVIIAHQAIVRAFFAYFIDVDPAECTTLEVPLHRVYELTPLPNGKYDMKHFDVAVDNLPTGH
jgi:broad specificity phosphatase PhoE